MTTADAVITKLTETPKMLVRVTQDDIDEGEREDCFMCPVARALTREFPGCIPEVTGTGIELYEFDDACDGLGTWLFHARTPKKAAEFIEAFDDGEGVEPFEFTLTFTPPSQSR